MILPRPTLSFLAILAYGLAVAACSSSSQPTGLDGGDDARIGVDGGRHDAGLTSDGAHVHDGSPPADAPAAHDATPARDSATEGAPRDTGASDGGSPKDGPTTPDTGTSARDAGDGGASAEGLHVVGHTLVDHGQVVRLLGVDHSGGEFACVGSDGTNGYGFFDGPTDDSLVVPMLSWNINAVRIPLNEECWLGINGVAAAYSGSNYQSAVKSLVTLFRSHGMYVILDLHWGAPGTSIGTSQQPMADADHASAFWASVATTFKGDQDVVFDVFNEPYLASNNISDGTDPWTCLEGGCAADLQTPLSGTYQTAGMQSLVTAIRATGAKNVIMVAGLDYTSDLSGWLAHEPTDATGNLAASLHLYNFNGCTDETCWNARYQALAGSVPIVTGENGENDCGTGFVDAYMTWADGLGISYLGWSWNAFGCSSFPALISSYDGGVPSAYGLGLKTHLLAL